MSSQANVLAFLLLTVCAALWLRSMWHQFQYTQQEQAP